MPRRLGSYYLRTWVTNFKDGQCITFLFSRQKAPRQGNEPGGLPLAVSLLAQRERFISKMRARAFWRSGTANTFGSDIILIWLSKIRRDLF